MGVRVKNLLGERVEKISKELGIPKVTVEKVIRGYLKSLEESALRGEDVVIDNIVSIKIVLNEDEDLTGRCRLSTSLKTKLSQVELEEGEEEGVEYIKRLKREIES